MTDPQVVMQMSFAAPGAAPVWQTKTDKLRGWAFRRGRPNRMQPFGAARIDTLIDNRDGWLSPTNPVSPHYPDVKPMRRVRLMAELEGDTGAFYWGWSEFGSADIQGGGTQLLPLASGLIEQLPQVWPIRGRDAEVPVAATDGFKLLNLAEFVWGYRYNTLDPEDWPCGLLTGTVTPPNGPPFVPDDRSDERIMRVLDCIGWPAMLRDLDEGTVNILGSFDIFAGTANIFITSNALTYVQAIADTERGHLFIDKEGRVAFRSATYQGVDEPTVIFRVAAPAEHLYGNIGLDFEETAIANQITITTPNQSPSGFPEEDATSITDYGPRALSHQILDAEQGGVVTIFDYASALLAERKDPPMHVVGFEPVDRGTDATDWQYVLSRELLDIVRIHEEAATGEVLDIVGRIEQIAMSQTKTKFARWRVEWILSVVSYTST